MCFFNLTEEAYLEQNESFYTLITMICRKYSFQKVTQFSQVNNVLSDTAPNTHGIISRDICVSLI
jgi:23S rRNA U2552 (ribose-2'-O)-methylase RlmE/FtsJ